jgi:cytochrome c peroxidase
VPYASTPSGTSIRRWYPTKADGTVAIYDDLPPRYRANINRDPRFDLKPGDTPRISDRDIDDIVAFLETPTDGWVPDDKAAANTRSQP